jgi:hypothetical protein
MAVTTLPRALAGTRPSAAVHPLVLLACLVAPGLDLLGLVQSNAGLPLLSLAASAGAAVLLGVVWLRHLRETWLSAAALAMLASGALRLATDGGPEASLLSLLAVVALGLGGAFSSPVPDLDLSSVDV